MVEVDGHIDAVKLVHLDGQVSCDVSLGQWLNWLCGTKSSLLFSTNSTDNIPEPQVEGGRDRYKIVYFLYCKNLKKATFPHLTECVYFRVDFTTFCTFYQPAKS